MTLTQAGQPQTPPTRVLDDPSVEHGPVRFRHNGQETIDGYLARPKVGGKYPGVLVIAGNRITEEYIPNTCAALAVAGFVGLAPNIFHPLPAGAGTAQEYNAALLLHTESDVLEDVFAGVNYLSAQPFVRAGGMGVVGFCFGGRIALLFAARSSEVAAVVPFHPGRVQPGELRRLRAPVQIHHGTSDQSVPAESSRSIEKLLRAQGTPAQLFLYEGADHGFLAYTRPFYRADHAKLAWQRTIAFLHRHLR